MHLRLKECRRILKPSGSIRICLPDAQRSLVLLSRDPNLLSIAEDDQRHDVYSGLRPHIGKNDPHKLQTSLIPINLIIVWETILLTYLKFIPSVSIQLPASFRI